MEDRKITLILDDEKKEFKKGRITLFDNLVATKHQILENNLALSEVDDPEEFEKVQLDFAKTIAMIFDEKFTADQLLKGLQLEDKKKVQEIYLLALGGSLVDEKEPEEEIEKK